MLTEEKLTTALAAQIYELSVLNGHKFECNVDLMAILDPSHSRKVETEKPGRVIAD